MHFTIDQQDATTIFRLKEAKLDSANSSALKAEFLILAQPDVETLIVDLSEVTYIDSAGLSALLLAERQQSAHGGDVRLVGANESVQSLLRLTQLDRVFPLFATTKEAVEAEIIDEPEISSPKSSVPLRAGAIAAGGSLGAAALAAIMMGHSDDPDMMGDEEEFDDDDDEFDDDDDEFDDDLDEEDDDEEDDDEPAEEDPDPKVDEEPDPAVIEEDIDVDDFDDDFDDDDDDEEDDLL